MQDIRDIVYDTLGVHQFRTSDVLICRKNEKEPFAKILYEGKTVLRVGNLSNEDYGGIVVRLTQ